MFRKRRSGYEQKTGYLHFQRPYLTDHRHRPGPPMAERQFAKSSRNGFGPRYNVFRCTAQRGVTHLQVLVRNNNVDQALRALKKKMQREGVFREMKIRRHYEKPSERRAREKAEAIRRARKLARKRLQREGLLPMKPRTIPGAGGRGGPPRAPRS
jgi:small subunit ribosomal protein S21